MVRVIDESAFSITAGVAGDGFSGIEEEVEEFDDFLDFFLRSFRSDFFPWWV